MVKIKSGIGAGFLLCLLLAACAPQQPISSPKPTDSAGQPTAYPGLVDSTAEPNDVPVNGTGGGNVSVQTPDPTSVSDSGTGIPAESEDIVLTLVDSGHSLTLEQGQTFLLKLGEAYEWQIIIADQSVVSRVKNVMVIRGAQGLYAALQPGQTEFSAQGEPLCRSEKPACMMPSVLFRQTVVVE